MCAAGLHSVSSSVSVSLLIRYSCCTACDIGCLYPQSISTLCIWFIAAGAGLIEHVLSSHFARRPLTPQGSCDRIDANSRQLYAAYKTISFRMYETKESVYLKLQMLLVSLPEDL